MFKGTATAIITPFDDNLDIDYTSLDKFVEFQLTNEIDSLVVLGTTGEAPTIELNEREKIIDSVVQKVNGKVPVIVGTGTNNTKDVAEFNKIAEKYNANGLLIVNPYYNKGTQSSIIEHYKFISERTYLPIILYNVASRTGINLLPDTVLKIQQDCKNVIGIKEASGDINQIAKLCANKPDNFLVYSGNDDQALPIIALGGVGVISTTSNVFPKQMHLLTKTALEGDFENARSIHNKLLNFMNDLFIETNPTPVKFAVSYLGYCKNTLRLPMSAASANTMAIIKSHIDSLR
ncbi:MAG: 4-hydroxy-tetrahydrodipicolinate synthase [Ignavibacteriales bacterium]|nr:MAG: 4-hydroxy-tetrahydrodipicolinate synthase [Ignavibacteriales bacterium]